MEIKKLIIILLSILFVMLNSDNIEKYGKILNNTLFRIFFIIGLIYNSDKHPDIVILLFSCYIISILMINQKEIEKDIKKLSII